MRWGPRISADRGVEDDRRMAPLLIDRARLDRELIIARQRSLTLVPFSPASDAAMGQVEDLERALWRLDRLDLGQERLSRLETAEQPARQPALV